MLFMQLQGILFWLDAWTSSESSRDIIVLSYFTIMSTTLRNRFLGIHLAGWLLWGPGTFIYTWMYLFSLGLCPGSLVPTDLKKWRARNWVQCPMKLWGFPSGLNGKTSFPSPHASRDGIPALSPPCAIFLQAAEGAKRSFGPRQTRGWMLGLLFFISFLLVTLP